MPLGLALFLSPLYPWQTQGSIQISETLSLTVSNSVYPSILRDATAPFTFPPIFHIGL